MKPEDRRLTIKNYCDQVLKSCELNKFSKVVLGEQHNATGIFCWEFVIHLNFDYNDQNFVNYFNKLYDKTYLKNFNGIEEITFEKVFKIFDLLANYLIETIEYVFKIKNINEFIKIDAKYLHSTGFKEMNFSKNLCPF